jgi:arylformamidase
MTLRLGLVAALLLPAPSVPAHERHGRPCSRETGAIAGEARKQGRVPAGPAQPARVIRYGNHPRQAVDFYPAPRGSGRPLVMFIHGGGWAFGNRGSTVQSKPGWFTQNGFHFASAGYRVLPDAPVEEQARDVARALRTMRVEAARLGFDPDSIVLMGHSAGAHLAALVATNPGLAGADFGAIRGVILLDGAGYDVARNMVSPGVVARRIYLNAFGSDPARQRALSPVSHAAAPNAPDWLILHVADRGASTQQSALLAEGLRTAGARVRVEGIGGTDHGRMNRELGRPGDSSTAHVQRFLANLFPERPGGS